MIRDTDRGMREFVRRLGVLEAGIPTTVGVHEDDGAKQHAGSKLTVGDIAVIHEFEYIGGKGTKSGGRKRQRSWMRRTFAKQKKTLRKQLGEAAILVLQGAAVEEAFKGPGVTLQEAIIDASGEETGQLHEAMSVRVRGEIVATGHGGVGVTARRRLRRASKAVGRWLRGVRNRIRGRV